MTAPSLPAIRALLEGATPGPWAHDPDGFMGCGQVYTANADLYGGNIAAPSGDLYPRSGYSPKEDMLFIAAAPSIVAQLVAVVERVEGLHSPVEPTPSRPWVTCSGCTNGCPYPCPTIKAIREGQ